MTTGEWCESSTGREYSELLYALRSRPLTMAELQRVAEIGYDLLVVPNVSFSPAEKQAEFAALLSIQHMLQLAASTRVEDSSVSTPSLLPPSQEKEP